ncbi:hypothetical protein QX233_04715 [Chryseobacterium gambrini]|uniref:Acetyltransferase (GNAT) domain-containing protein n=1 Tax=Chryseobacterium gambrini TaxID=373672 RepID=A0AAJ1R2D6_9FLAO|nr:MULTISPECIES: hypothetical protein [Chryseobacterium]MDN4011755.1 hypothetical protein [Chryseobacterium gambrini]MDN4029274.1 hypothetical protein [Chryseobacterium gambrini]
MKYNEIDFEKYSKCLENSAQWKYSASKDFLDITSGKQWELLVYNDYEAVMPVPFVKKIGFKIVINPKLCQQLGIFSNIDDVKINDLFLSFLEKKYNIWYYGFNDKNTFSKLLKRRKNFLIYPDNYEIVRQKYSPKRKRKLRLDDDILQKSEVREVSIFNAWEFISKNLIGAKDEKDKNSFLQIFTDLEKAGYLKLKAFFYGTAIINLIAVYSDDKTIALLGTFNDKDHVKLSGSSFIIDDVIRENIQTKIFDFEGSDIPAIEEFFRGFRPELKSYPVIFNSKKQVIKSFFRQ